MNIMKQNSIIFLSLFLCFALAGSSPPDATRITVNQLTDGDQDFPRVTGLQDGAFAVVFETRQIPGGNGIDVALATFNYFGDRIASTRANSEANNNQKNPDVIALSNGNILAVWQSFGQVNLLREEDIYGQIFDVNTLEKIGNEFLVNIDTDDKQVFPRASALQGGGFVITWDSQGDIIARIFDNAGDPITGEIVVNDVTADPQEKPSISSLSSGGFVIVWESQVVNQGRDILGQMFDSGGSKIGPIEFVVNTETNDNQVLPAVTKVGQGFAVVWRSSNQIGAGRDVFLQIFNQNAQKVGEETLVNFGKTEGDQDDPDIVFTESGFAVSWEDDRLDSVFIQKFNSNGARLGGEIQVNQNNGRVASDLKLAKLSFLDSIVGVYEDDLNGNVDVTAALLLDEEEDENNEGDDNIAVIVGGVVGGILLTALSFVVFRTLRNRENRQAELTDAPMPKRLIGNGPRASWFGRASGALSWFNLNNPGRSSFRPYTLFDARKAKPPTEMYSETNLNTAEPGHSSFRPYTIYDANRDNI